MLPGPIDGRSGHWDPASPRVGIPNTHCRARHTVGVREVWADGHMEGIHVVPNLISYLFIFFNLLAVV